MQTPEFLIMCKVQILIALLNMRNVKGIYNFAFAEFVQS